jgi:hypothetical protein
MRANPLMGRVVQHGLFVESLISHSGAQEVASLTPAAVPRRTRY